MKKILPVLCLLTLTNTLFSQPRSQRDSIGFPAWKRAIMQAPVLTGASAPRIIVPHEPALCFKTEFDLKLSAGSRLTEQCMLVHGGTGVVGLLPPSRSGIQNKIEPEKVDFSFFVTSLKGNAYRYFNNKGKNSTIDHWVSTGNTEQHQYQQMGADFSRSVDLSRKNVTAAFCNGSITAMSYRVADNPDMTWFLYGDRFPEKLHPQKFLGNFGVGYLYCTEGLYLVMEFRTPGYTAHVSEMQSVNTCLNTGVFKELEVDFANKRTEALQKEKQKLDRRTPSGECAMEETNLLNFRKAKNQEQQLAVQQSRNGNTYQNTNAQKSMLSMMDPLAMVQENILTTELSLCKANKANERGQRSAAVRVGCLSSQLGSLRALEAHLKQLDQQYEADPGKAYAEKSKYYLQHLPRGCP